jgi:tRNA 2-thiouridine synthesizing protein A
MKFVDNIKADVRADIVHLMCPMHLLQLEELIKAVKNGQIIEVVTDYDGALEDIPAWCARTGNEFVGLANSDDCYRLYVKKR